MKRINDGLSIEIMINSKDNIDITKEIDINKLMEDVGVFRININGYMKMDKIVKFLNLIGYQTRTKDADGNDCHIEYKGDNKKSLDKEK